MLGVRGRPTIGQEWVDPGSVVLGHGRQMAKHIVTVQNR